MSLRSTRLRNSAVVWSWIFNGLRLTSYLLLLPLLSRELSEPDFGFYWILVSLVSAVPLLDLGFSTAVDRGLSYAMAGAKELKSQGIAPHETDAPPNFELLWKLLHTTRAVYRYLSGGIFIILGTWGTYVVSLRLYETSNPVQTWWAWGLTLLGAIFEMYSGWWNVYLRGLNQVLLCSRILTVVFALKFLLAGAFLLSGAGLLSVPIATLIASFVQRSASRHYALRFLSTHPSKAPVHAEVVNLLQTLWPNSWRVGVHCLSTYLTPHASMVICTKVLGLSATAQFGLTLQLMAIIQGMSTVWLQVKWPLVGQYLARKDYNQLRRLVRIRLLLQLGTFILMAILLIPLAPLLLDWLKTDKRVLPMFWFSLVAFATLLDMHFNAWTTLISLGNRLPFLWHTVVTNVAGIILAMTLMSQTSLGVGGLILGPLITNLAFNYWHWPLEGARMLGASWWQFMSRFRAGH